MSWTVKHYDSVTSTQDKARENLIAGIVIQANHQTAGKGRHGREWVSHSGNLFFSFVLKPDCSPELYGQIALKTGLAVGQAIQDSTQKKVTLKWPNDILINQKKCAGILIEAEEEMLIIGIGINMSNAPEGASALDREDNNRIRETILDNFDKLREIDFQTIKKHWLSMAHPVGQKVSVKIGNDVRSGYFEGIDDQGNLIIDGKRISSGEVIL